MRAGTFMVNINGRLSQEKNTDNEHNVKEIVMSIENINLEFAELDTHIILLNANLTQLILLITRLFQICIQRMIESELKKNSSPIMLLYETLIIRERGDLIVVTRK